MKTKVSFLTTIILLSLFLFSTQAYSINPCVETGPRYGSWSSWSCVKKGEILETGILSSTSATVCVSGSVTPPSLIDTIISDGMRTRSRSYTLKCDEGGTVVETPGVNYKLKEKWSPYLPSTFNKAGVFVFTKKIRAISSSSTCDSTDWIDVDFFTVIVGKILSLATEDILSFTNTPGEEETLYVSVDRQGEALITVEASLENMTESECLSWSPEPEEGGTSKTSVTFKIKINE